MQPFLSPILNTARRLQSRSYRALLRTITHCLAAALLLIPLLGCGGDAYEDRFQKSLHPPAPPPVAAPAVNAPAAAAPGQPAQPQPAH